MPDAAHRVRLEGVDFGEALPFVRLAESFRMALQPTKLFIALMMVLLVYFGGVTLDFMWGVQAAGPERLPVGTSNVAPLGGGLGSVASMHRDYHIFDLLVRDELGAFGRLLGSATSLNLGLTRGPGGFDRGVLGAATDMAVDTPTWLWTHHPWFFLLFGLYAGTVFFVLGGAIARLAATQACAGRSVDLLAAARFARPRALWLVLAPALPLLMAGGLWLFLAVVGWALFNLPVLDIAGSLIYGPLLFLGFLAASLVLLTLLGAGLFCAAIAVEGTDAFDAVSRVFSFLIYRPMRFFFYMFVVVVYGALTYLIVTLVVGLTLWLTASAAGAWSDGFGVIHDAAVRERPVTGDGSTANVAAWWVNIWEKLLFAGTLAYAVSYFFTSQVWVYLLMRRASDATDFADYEPEPEPAAAGADPLLSAEVLDAGGKVEPTGEPSV